MHEYPLPLDFETSVRIDPVFSKNRIRFKFKISLVSKPAACTVISIKRNVTAGRCRHKRIMRSSILSSPLLVLIVYCPNWALTFALNSEEALVSSKALAAAPRSIACKYLPAFLVSSVM